MMCYVYGILSYSHRLTVAILELTVTILDLTVTIIDLTLTILGRYSPTTNSHSSSSLFGLCLQFYPVFFYNITRAAVHVAQSLTSSSKFLGWRVLDMCISQWYRKPCHQRPHCPVYQVWHSDTSTCVESIVYCILMPRRSLGFM